MATALQDDTLRDADVSRDDFLTPVHGCLNVARLLAGFGVLFAWFVVAPAYLNLPAYVAISVVLCQFHQRELNDWAHESCHWNLVPDRRWNDRLGFALASFWFGVTLADLRRSHFIHHRTETFFVPGDPETGGLVIHSRRDLLRGILEDLSGISAIRHYLGFLSDRSRARVSGRKGGGGVPWPMLGVIGAHLAIFAALVWAGRWDIYVIYYATMATLYRLSHRIRIYAQHLVIPESGVGTCDDSVVARTVRTNPLLRLILASDVMLYHYEHHRRPELPYRALRRICARRVDPNVYVERLRPIQNALWKM